VLVLLPIVTVPALVVLVGAEPKPNWNELVVPTPLAMTNVSGVVPDEEQCEKAGITVVNTDFQHNDMRDTGPEKAKDSIQAMLDKFLADTDSAVAPVDTRNAPPKILEPGPVSLYVPVEKPPQTFGEKLKKSLSLTETKKVPSATN
jgi:hypothetical protein